MSTKDEERQGKLDNHKIMKEKPAKSRPCPHDIGRIQIKVLTTLSFVVSLDKILKSKMFIV